jgi:hypothetical protein
VRTTCERCVQDLLYCDARGCRSVGRWRPANRGVTCSRTGDESAGACGG